jgi:hypothetical protein
VYGNRSSIWIRTLFVTVIYVALVYFTERDLVRRFESRALAAAVAFVLVQSAAIVAILGVLLTRRALAESRMRRSTLVAAEVHDAVSQHAAGADRLRVLRGLPRRDVVNAVAAFLGATRGSMHERVAALARDLGITPSDARVLEHASAVSLYERALLAARLQPRAAELAAGEIPRALAIGDERQSIAALDLMRTWRRALDVKGLDYALAHPSHEVRARAFAVMPYVRPSHAERIADGLRDASPHVRIAAAQAAAKLQFTDAVPALEAALGDEHREVAVAAAFALAATPEGLARLQDAAGDAIAFEALEKATIGRLELA